MTKKHLFFLLFFVFALANIYSLPEFKLSAGGGLYTTGVFGGGYEASYISSEGNGMYLDQTIHHKYSYFGGGIFGFFDMTFVEANLGFFIEQNEWEYDSSEFWEASDNGAHVYAGIDIGLLLKYPFVINKNITIFPLAGINYRRFFLFTNERDDFWEWVNKEILLARFGGGIDYSLTDNFFFRGSVLYGFRIIDAPIPTSLGYDYKASPYPGHGFDIKLAVGFRR